MTPRQSFLVKIGAAIAALCLVFFFATDWLRWWVFEGRIHDVLLAVRHQPTAADIVGVRPKILAEAHALWFRPESIDLRVSLEQHTSNAYAMKEDQLECYWFVVAHAVQGTRTASWEERIDNKVADSDPEALEKGGVGVKRKDLMAKEGDPSH